MRDWETLQTPFPPEGVFEFTITTTSERMLAMLSVLITCGPTIGYDWIDDHNVDVLAALGATPRWDVARWGHFNWR